MIIIKTFLFNLLCSVVSCDPDFGLPEITDLELAAAEAIEQNGLIVDTKSGSVEGYFMKSADGRLIHAFEGIPYAEPPVNEFRFRAALKKKTWKTLISAKAISHPCLQIHATKLFRVVGHEDCLYLNIYTPQIPRPENEIDHIKLLPVIIWIHGGAFIFGSGGEYGPAYLLDQDILLVTINYRLGILGFLSTGDLNSTGNYGLKDQALAIEWIHENIERFGGNPNKITLMGQSAGAVSVHLHMLSNHKSRSYFHAGISISGNAFVHWALRSRQEGRRYAVQTAQQMGCPYENNADMMHCLRQLNPVALVANQINLFEWLPFPVVLFGPIIEMASPEAFITEMPDTLYDRKEVAKIPWITSVTSDEGHTALLFTESLLKTETIKTQWYDLAPLVLDYKGKVNNTRELSRRISKFYFGEQGPRKASIEQLSDIASDRYFNFGFVKALQRHSIIAPTYGYYFNYKGNYGLGKAALGLSSTEWGVGHTEDVFYLLNSSSIYPGFKRHDPERDLSKIMTNLIQNFASDRIPSYTDADGENLLIWKKVDNIRDPKVLQLNRDVKTISLPFLERIRFWQNMNLSDMKLFSVV